MGVARNWPIRLRRVLHHVEEEINTFPTVYRTLVAIFDGPDCCLPCLAVYESGLHGRRLYRAKNATSLIGQFCKEVEEAYFDEICRMAKSSFCQFWVFGGKSDRVGGKSDVGLTIQEG